jgi:hypothetical protein
VTQSDGTKTSYQIICNSAQFETSMRFSRHDHTITSSKIDAISVPEQGLVWQTYLDHPRLELKNGRAVFSANVSSNAMGSARFSNGNRLNKIAFFWNEDQLSASSNQTTALVKVSIENDFQLVERAIAAMTASTVSGTTDALGPLPFRRTSILQALFQ